MLLSAHLREQRHVALAEARGEDAAHALGVPAAPQVAGQRAARLKRRGAAQHVEPVQLVREVRPELRLEHRLLGSVHLRARRLLLLLARSPAACIRRQTELVSWGGVRVGV
jgi:hypothetical protein